LIALLAGLIWLVVGRSLRGLTQLAEALGERSVHVLHPLENALYAPELMPIVDATNALLTRLDESIQLQKMFVADAAHELRTPLTALKLQLQ
ncbi:two-component sensor histidine kinase, partial [Cryobacterium sp. RTS3]